jgi:hypothetical protein
VPVATDHLRQIGLLQGVGAAQFQRLDRAVRQHRAQGERQVGAVPHFLDQRRDQARYALAAVRRVTRQRVPAAVDELPICLLPAAGSEDLAVRPARDFTVAAGKFAGLLENGLGQIGSDFFATGQCGHLLERCQFTQHELHVTKGGGVLTHGTWTLV